MPRERLRTIHGYELHDIIGLSAYDLIAEADVPKVLALQNAGKASAERLEVSARRKDGALLLTPFPRPS